MREQLKGGRVKGGMVRSHLEWVRRTMRQGSLDEVLQRLPPAVAAEVSTVLPASWTSFESLILLDRAIAAVSGAAGTMRELGRFSAQQNLSTTYRAFRRADIPDFFRRSAALHDQFQDFGREEYVAVGERAGRIIHRDYSCFSPDYCESAAGYYEEVMKMHGGERPVVEHPQCVARGAPECVFELRW